MCGIIGIVGSEAVALRCMTASPCSSTVVMRPHAASTAPDPHPQDNGLVRDVFVPAVRLLVAHRHRPIAATRPPVRRLDEAQPFYVNSPYGIALAHNGNLINTEALRREVCEQDRRHINTQSDSEVLLNVLAHELMRQERLDPDAAFKAVAEVHRRCLGGYAVVGTVLGLGLVGFRDPNGIRPLVLAARRPVPNTPGSESVAGPARFTACAMSPGETIVITARANCMRGSAHTGHACAASSNTSISPPRLDDRERLGAQAHARA